MRPSRATVIEPDFYLIVTRPLSCWKTLQEIAAPTRVGSIFARASPFFRPSGLSPFSSFSFSPFLLFFFSISPSLSLFLFSPFPPFPLFTPHPIALIFSCLTFSFFASIAFFTQIICSTVFPNEKNKDRPFRKRSLVFSFARTQNERMRFSSAMLKTSQWAVYSSHSSSSRYFWSISSSAYSIASLRLFMKLGASPTYAGSASNSGSPLSLIEYR